MNKYRDLRKQFDDAGIDLGVLCYNMNGNIADEEIDYAFRMAQALGVKEHLFELDSDHRQARRLFRGQVQDDLGRPWP